MAAKKTLQEIFRPIMGEHLEKRRRFQLAERAQNRKVTYPHDLTFKGLADKYGVHPSTLHRWIDGRTVAPRRLDAVELARFDYRRIMQNSRRTVAKFGGNVGLWSSAIDGAAYSLDFKHGRPTGKIYTYGWKELSDIADLVLDIVKDGYNFMLLLFNPEAESDGVPIPGGYFVSPWLTIKKDFWNSEKIESYLRRQWLVKGDIHAVLFTTPKPKTPKPKKKKRGPYDPRTLH
jgi:hypothetical protein